MEVILLEKVDKLGNLGDRVKVKTGYGRNFLIPSGKAASITTANLEKFEARRAELEKAQVEALAAAGKRREALIALDAVTVTAKAGEEGKLFGSIGAPDIVDALAAFGVIVDKHEVRLPNGPLRHTGEHEVVIHLHSEIDAPLKVNITAEG